MDIHVKIIFHIYLYMPGIYYLIYRVNKKLMNQLLFLLYLLLVLMSTPYSLIGSQLSILSLVWIIIIAIQRNNREYINFDIDNGLICYSCKEKIKYDSLKEWPPSKNRELCKQCKRDKSLDNILGKKGNYIRDLAYSRNWNYIFMYTVLSVFFIQLCNMIIKNSYIGFLTGLILFILQFLNYLNFRFNTK